LPSMTAFCYAKTQSLNALRCCSPLLAESKKAQYRFSGIELFW